MKQLKSALISAVIVALFAVVGYVIAVGSIWKIDWRVMADVGIMSLATGMASILKNLLTTKSGNFLGIVNHK